MQKSIAEIQSKLDSPDCRKNILMVAHKILQDNAYSRKMLKRAIDNLNHIVAECQSTLVDRILNNTKNIFQTYEVYDIIRKQFFSLENRRLELDSRCHNTKVQEKIQLIASGILRKNFKFVKRLEQVDSQLKQLTQRLQHAQKQLDVLKLHLSKNKHHVHYKLLSSDKISIQATASVIADAILREPQAIQLVARSFGNSLEIDKTWELMSKLDKDELTHKKILREL